MLLAVGAVPALWGQGATVVKKPFRDDFKTATDGVTKGWLVEIPWPDQDDVSQSWRTIPATLVIARHGKVVRKFSAASSFWSWNFWNGGREVVVQVGGALHGNSSFARWDVRSGKELESWDGDIYGDIYKEADKAPAWVKAAVAE
jgi:hypothetical protein